MKEPPFLLGPLHADLDRTEFRSGPETLDRHFRKQVSRDIRRRVAACFVAAQPDGRVAGYYTLASASVWLSDLPQAIARRLPRHPGIPAVRMGRLAVDQAFTGQGLGGALLADALHRTVRSEIAAYAWMVDAQDDAAVSFFRHHGFTALPNTPSTMFLPLATVAHLAR